MAEQYYSEIENRVLLKIGGAERAEFLHNILTNDVAAIGVEGAGFGGLLSPQGKILFDFFILREKENYLLDVAAAQVDDLLKRLMFYRLRADVNFKIETGSRRIFAIWGGEMSLPNGALVVTDPRLAEMGWRMYAADKPDAVQGDYQRKRILAGMPEGSVDYSYGNSFPHEALFDQIGGVDFVKGCYVGQEVISRVHHRGTARKRVIQVKSDTPLPPPNTPIVAGGRSVGEITSVSGKDGLALVRLDRVQSARAKGEGLHAGDIAVETSIQSWVSFDWPGA